MHNASGDSKELDAYIKRIGALESEQQRRVVQHLMKMRDILTPAQRDQFFAAIMQRICVGCRTAVPGHTCVCGMHSEMKG
jgi:Spy/CpxP family protein refolding chaperone